MNKTTKTVGAGVAALATVALTAGSASADNAIIKIGKYGELSSTHKVAWVKAKVICSEDTTSAYAQVTLWQVTHGQLQHNTGSVNLSEAVECSGEEEVIYVPVRRPTGGYKWVKGAARAENLVFTTYDPSNPNGYTDTAKGRTIYLR